MPFSIPDRPGQTVDELKSDLKNCLYPHVHRKVFAYTVETTETPIAHGLSEVPTYVGWFQRANATVWRSKAPDSRFIYLIASVSVVCDIEVSCA
jgi:hypothetical protein